MSRKKITTSGNSAALLLSRELLAQMGIDIGDEVEISLMERTLVVRPTKELERDKKVKAAIEDVFSSHRGLLQDLAAGPGKTEPGDKA